MVASAIIGQLTWNTSWDDNHVSTSKGLFHSAICWEETLNLLCLFSANVPLIACISGCSYSDGGDVGQISGDTWSVDDIVESELVDERASLEEKRQGLTNATGGTCDD